MFVGQRRRNEGGVEDRTRPRTEQNRTRTGGPRRTGVVQGERTLGLVVLGPPEALRCPLLCPQVVMFADDFGVCGTNVEQLEEN